MGLRQLRLTQVGGGPARAARQPRQPNQLWAGKISDQEHLSRSMICWRVFRVMLCWQFSKRKRLEGVIPSFLANAAYVVSPRLLRRKIASWLSNVCRMGRR